MTKRYYKDADLTAGPDVRGPRLEVAHTINAAGDQFTEAAEFEPRTGFNAMIGGSGWVATVRLQMSTDGGVTWVDDSTTDVPRTWAVDTIGAGTLWRIGCLNGDRTSGTIPVSLSN